MPHKNHVNRSLRRRKHQRSEAAKYIEIARAAARRARTNEPVNPSRRQPSQRTSTELINGNPAIKKTRRDG